MTPSRALFSWTPVDAPYSIFVLFAIFIHQATTTFDWWNNSALLQCNFETHAKSEIHVVIRLQAAVDIYTFTHMLAPRSLFDDAQFLSQESKKQRPTVDLSVSQSLARLVYRWLEARRGAAIRGTTAPGPKIKNTVMPIQKPHRDSLHLWSDICLGIFLKSTYKWLIWYIHKTYFNANHF